MKMVCVNSRLSYPVGILTIGKIYESIEDNLLIEKYVNLGYGNFYLIKDDFKNINCFYEKRFVSLKQFRKQKINKIYESVR